MSPAPFPFIVDVTRMCQKKVYGIKIYGIKIYGIFGACARSGYLALFPLFQLPRDDREASIV